MSDDTAFTNYFGKEFTLLKEAIIENDLQEIRESLAYIESSARNVCEEYDKSHSDNCELREEVTRLKAGSLQ